MGSPSSRTAILSLPNCVVLGKLLNLSVLGLLIWKMEVIKELIHPSFCHKN